VAVASDESRKKAVAAVTEQILICCDGSQGAERAVDTAATLLDPRHARRPVLIAPPVTT